jgi:hypothetical protein
MEQSEMKPYEPPKMTDYGDLRKITAAQATSAAIDRNFPAGTPQGDTAFGC